MESTSDPLILAIARLNLIPMHTVKMELERVSMKYASVKTGSLVHVPVMQIG